MKTSPQPVFLFGNPAAVWVLVFLLLAGMLQFAIPYPVDGDTAYHVAVGRLIDRYGILHSFPWTPYSWLADHYADKEFLFHLLFVPLTGFEWLTAARVVGTLAGATVLSCLYLVLRGEEVRYPGAWAMLPLTSIVFLCRFVLVRPHLLSIALALTIAWAASRGRLFILFLATLLYPLAYVAFWQMTLLLLLAVETARLLSGERLRWRPAAVALLGIAIGIAIHPNSANLARINWIHMADVLFGNSWQGKAGFELGNELLPYSLPIWATQLSPNVAMTVAAVLLVWRYQRRNSISLAFTLTAIGFGLLTVKSARFVEYFVPFSVAALALAARPVAGRILAPALLGVSLVVLAVVGSGPMATLLSQAEKIDPPDAKAFRQFIPPGAQVFNCEWELTGALMLALPERRFIVALDPTLLYVKDPGLYELWYRLPREAPPDAAGIIRRRFNSRYVVATNRSDFGAFYDRLDSDPTVRTLYLSDKWVVFDLGGVPDGPAARER